MCSQWTSWIRMPDCACYKCGPLLDFKTIIALTILSSMMFAPFGKNIAWFLIYLIVWELTFIPAFLHCRKYVQTYHYEFSDRVIIAIVAILSWGFSRICFGLKFF